MTQKLKLAVLIIILTVGLLHLQIPRGVSAQEFSQCGGENPASAIIPLAAGSYDIYVKLGVKTASEPASVYLQPIDELGSAAGCKNLGTVAANGQNYVKVLGSYSHDGRPSMVYISSASSTSMQSAAAPQLVFTDANTTLCQLDAECLTNYQGSQMVLSPQKMSLNSDSARIGYLVAPDPNKIDKVIYSVDGKPVYEKNTLEPFNFRYVSGGEHVLTRRVIFTNGSSVSDTEKVERGTSADLTYAIQALFFGQSRILRIVVYVVCAFLLWMIVLSVLKSIRRRQIWKQTHIAANATSKYDPNKAGSKQTFYDETILMTLFRYRKLLLGLLGVSAGLLLVSTFIIGVFTVDGVSMYPTLNDKSVHPLVKAQNTFSKINRREYVPPRGTIVVVQKEDNNLFDPQAAAAKNYVVKRVVALPNERIVIKNGVVTVFNKENEKGFVPDDEFKWVKDLTGSEYFNIDITLNDSELFVIGDNRDESIDSRFYGPIDTSHVVGKVLP